MIDKQYPYLVSVLMPAYNASGYIEDAIESILGQSFRNFEFLIIDDGSTDSTVELIKRYSDSRIKLIQNETNKGLIYTLNKGLDIAQGKYIARMDADDISKPERIEKQFTFLEANPAIDILGTAFNILNTQYEIHHPIYNEDIRIKLLDDNAFAHPSVMMRTSALQKYNLYYKSEYKHVEDYQFWIQAAINGLGLANLDDILLLYRQHDSQVTSVNYKEQQSAKNPIRLEYFSHYFGDCFTVEELMFILNPENVDLVSFIALLDRLGKVNKQKNIFYDKYFDHYIDVLLYRKVMADKVPVKMGDICNILKNNISLHIKKTILKIKIKSYFSV